MQMQCAAARRAAVRSPPRGRVSRTHPVARADAERASCAAWPVRYALGSSATDTRTSQKDRIVHSSCSQRAAPGDPAPAAAHCSLRVRARARIPACPARRTDGTWARAGNQRSGGRRRMRRAAHRIASRRTGVRRDHARAGPGPREARRTWLAGTV